MLYKSTKEIDNNNSIKKKTKIITEVMLLSKISLKKK